ncbi:uncharacterized protein LOC113523527 [Galleria mellonella]|uniref:Uncharacterized protein LOC113523527 n=1 Tax=Galleria mellonella TaxID=7137 RepID=A0ABM3MR72_GALME|nr:uncharacterized protein LOC113523527 [Galleria mellonella]
MKPCAVLRCKGKGTHIFPRNHKIRILWERATGRMNFKAGKHSRVCASHFKPEDFNGALRLRRRLKKCAVPSVNLPVIQNDEQPIFEETSVNFCTEPKSIPNFSVSISMNACDVSGGNIAMKIEESSECRACLQVFGAGSRLINLFQPWNPKLENMGETIAEDLSKIANIQISELDTHSTVICQICFERLREACIFTALVRNSDCLLRQRVSLDSSMNQIWPKPIQVEKNINGQIYGTNVEIKQEVLSEDEQPDTNGLDESYRDYLDIKIEPEEIIEMRPTQTIVNGLIPTSNSVEHSRLLNGNANEDEYREGDSLETTIKEEPPSDDEELNVDSVDLPLECMLCTKSFHSLSGLKVHVITQHSYKSVKRKCSNSPSPKKMDNNRHHCTICQRNFQTSTDLLVHETCHNKHVCYGCNSKFDVPLKKNTFNYKTNYFNETQKELYRSKNRKSEDNEEEEEEHTNSLQCKLCNETFTDDYYMNIHQEIHHSATSQWTAPVDTPTSMESEVLNTSITEHN